MQVAVTGSSGHIGNNLCRELLFQGHRVRALVRKDSPALAGLPVNQVHGDLGDLPSLRRLVQDSEVVFHAAAHISVGNRQDGLLLRTNLEGTRTIIRACREEGVRRLVHFSSIHALQPEPYDEPMDEERPLALDDPMPYGQSKARAEKLVLEAAAEGFDALVVSPTSVIGPDDYKPSLMGTFLYRISRNRMPLLVPGGYDFVDVRDVVQGAIRAMEQGKTGRRYLLAGKWHPVTTLAREVSRIIGRERERTVIPMWMAKLGLPLLRGWSLLMGEEPLYTREALRALETGHRNISHARAEKELGYSTRPLEETLLDTVQWFHSHDKTGRNG